MCGVCGLAVRAATADAAALCDACLQLGSPWLPALHGGRPRAKAVKLKKHRVPPAGGERPLRKAR
jgi:hypothetical protein